MVVVAAQLPCQSDRATHPHAHDAAPLLLLHPYTPPQAGLLPDFSLSVRSMPSWGSAQYLALLICALLLAHLLGYHLWRAKQESPNPNPNSNPKPNPSHNSNPNPTLP
eukprot:scaffold5850_cov61-Phaeocystis_antarctica.AAC.6